MAEKITLRLGEEVAEYSSKDYKQEGEEERP